MEETGVTEKTILCFGDSNTHGTKALANLQVTERHAPADRWPNVMATALGPEWTVIAEGLPGRTAVYDDPVEGAHLNGLTILPALLESHAPLDLVIILLGTNDTKPRFSAVPHDIMRGIERLVRMVRQSECGPNGAAPAVLVGAPLPIVETGVLAEIFEGAAAKSVVLPQRLAAMAARHEVGFIDLAPVAQVDPVDGVHLDAAAQHAVGIAIARAVQAQFG